MPDFPFMTHTFSADVSRRIGELVRECACEHPTPGLLVALSGGPDSVALLLAAAAWSRETGSAVAAAHFNYGLRPGEADRDAVFCRDLCAGLEIELFESAEDPRPAARTRGQGLEEAARHLRRGFFGKILAENDHLHCVAAGHHRDDQVETVLMRLFRGTGPAGLRGILPVNGQYIHPLLHLGRTEILTFLEECGQPWRTDASNLDGDNVRARIRRELMPLARGIFGPGSETVPARLADLLQQDMDLLDGITRTALAECRSPEHPDRLSISRLAALDRGLAARVLLFWLDEGQPSGLERVHVDAALDWLAAGQSGSGLDFPDGRRLVRDFDTLRPVTKSQTRPALRAAADYRILVGGEQADSIDLKGVGDPADESTWRLTCPASCLEGNLRVAHPGTGDRFRPLGLDGSKKLSDLLREHRVAREDRPGVLVVAGDAGILWVVGLSRAERTRLLPSTGQTVTISVAKRSEDQLQK